MRYSKIEEVLPGFIVPDYLQKEAKDRLFSDYYKKKIQWEDFVHDNYGAELTFGIRYYDVGMLIPIDWFILTGWLDHRNWDRMFYNETLHGEITEKEADFAYNHNLHFDLNTEKGKKQFAAEYEHLHKYLPGFIAKEDEKLNIPKLIALAKKKGNFELTTEDSNILAQLETKLMEENKLLEVKPVKSVAQKIGSIFPKLLANLKPGKAIMSK